MSKGASSLREDRAGGASPLSRCASQPKALVPLRGRDTNIFALNYEDGDRCPGCGNRNWHIGRTMAECGFCSTALPLARAA